MQDDTTERRNDGRKKRAAGGKALRAPPHRPRHAAPVGATQPQCPVVSVATGLSLATWNLIFAIISGEECISWNLQTTASTRSAAPGFRSTNSSRFAAH